MRRLLILATLTALTCACARQQSDNAIPRPTAYPRVRLYDTVYVAPPDLPAGFQVNAAAVTSTPSDHPAADRSPIWLDITYPAYKATLHCTFTPVDAASHADVIANRTQRMSLNLGDNRAEQTDLISASGAYRTSILTTAGRTLTPVQFLSEGQEWIISGALQMHIPNATPDSILPIVRAVTADIIHSAHHLK